MNYNGIDPAALAGIGVAYFAFFLIYYVWVSLALSKVFTKLGEQGFKAWVPILNIITLFKLGSVNPIWILIFLVPVANVVGTVMPAPIPKRLLMLLIAMIIMTTPMMFTKGTRNTRIQSGFTLPSWKSVMVLRIGTQALKPCSPSLVNTLLSARAIHT